MEEYQNNSPRPVNPRRRKRSKMQVFRDSYLPVIIFLLIVALIVVFVVGSLNRAKQDREDAAAASKATEEALAAEKQRLEREAVRLIAEADILAAGYDYDGAVALLDSFPGNMYDYDNLLGKREQYIQAKDTLVLWEDNTKVVQLSFHVLITDTVRTFSHKTYGSSFERNFITINEFSAILEQLYANGYILVSMDDVITQTENESGVTVYTAKELYLPAGKKPIMLTQTHANYYTYMIDGDSDGLPDKKGAGFASKLVIGADGELTCEMVDSSGATVTGDFDMVPILNRFIKEHPDFSYKGARATLAVTGYDGLFGYRTDPETKEKFSETFYQEQIEGVKPIIEKLRQDGYDFASYTYDNEAYGDIKADAIQEDLNKWNAEVVPLLGLVHTLAYAKEHDIAAPGETYSGEKYDILRASGFTIYQGFCTTGKPWMQITDGYVRIGRLRVTGSFLENKADWYKNLFDAKTVLDSGR